MFTGPVGPVEVFFYWPESILGNFYWPGAIGSPLASSPGDADHFAKQSQVSCEGGGFCPGLVFDLGTPIV